MTDDKHQSFIEFGGYDTALMSDSNLFQWMPMASVLPYWSVSTTGFRVGNNPIINLYGEKIPNQYKFENPIATILDTGT